MTLSLKSTKVNEQKKLSPSRLTRVGVMTGRTYFRAIVENDTKQEDIEKSDFWSLVASNFIQAGMLPRIEIVPDDLSWLVDAVVLQCGKTHAVVKTLNSTTLDAVSDIVVEADGFKVTWGGPHAKHRVVDGNGKVVKEGMASKEEAEIFLKSHRKAIGL